MSIITPYTGGVPNPNNPGTFNQDNTDWVAWITGAVPQINAAAQMVGFNQTPIETGNWTPVLWDAPEGGNQAAGYNFRSGRYSRMGSLCMVECVMGGIDKTGMSGTDLSIRGMPFAPAQGTRGAGPCRITNWAGGAQVPMCLASVDGSLRISDARSTSSIFATGIGPTDLGTGGSESAILASCIFRVGS